MKIKPIKIVKDEDGNDNVSLNILRGKVALKHIPIQIRIKSPRYYTYAFRYARAVQDIKSYEEVLRILNNDLSYLDSQVCLQKIRMNSILDNHVRELEWLKKEVNVSTDSLDMET